MNDSKLGKSCSRMPSRTVSLSKLGQDGKAKETKEEKVDVNDVKDKPNKINLVSMWNLLTKLEKNTNAIPNIEKTLQETNHKIEAAVACAEEARKIAGNARDEAKTAEKMSREAIALAQEVKGIAKTAAQDATKAIEEVSKIKSITTDMNVNTKTAISIASKANDELIEQRNEINLLKELVKKIEKLSRMKWTKGASFCQRMWRRMSQNIS